MERNCRRFRETVALSVLLVVDGNVLYRREIMKDKFNPMSPDCELNKTVNSDALNSKWRWKMDYCKKLGLAPDRKEVWKQADISYRKRMNLMPVEGE